MDLTVALDARYTEAADGSVWAQAGMGKKFWERYLDVFDRVRIIARAKRVKQPAEGLLPVTAENILFQGVPDYLGPLQYVLRYPSVSAGILSSAPAKGAVILRVGSQVANVLESRLHQTGRPYGLEVVGDPHDVFAPGVVDHPLRSLFRWHFSRKLRQQCLRAVGVAYVTKRTLQERYPARYMNVSVSDVELPEGAVVGGVAWTHYSSIELEAQGVASYVRSPKPCGSYHLVTVGSLAQMYKGTDVLIDAIALCVKAGCNVTAAVLGDGQYRAKLMAQAEQAGVGSRITFPGWVTPGAELRKHLDSADLFVLPSRTEGLPRAMIEAMARALPCIGSKVGGIPELLDECDMTPPGDAAALALKIREVLANPMRMQEMSRRNLAIASEYVDTALAIRRRSFYEHIRRCTCEWEKARGKR